MLRLEHLKTSGLVGWITASLDLLIMELLTPGYILLALGITVIIMRAFILTSLIGVVLMISVSPKLQVVAGDVFSLAQGGYSDGVSTPMDSMVAWISSEEPVMGTNSDGIDTGFVNTDAFTMLGEGTPLSTLGGHIALTFLTMSEMLGC